METLERPALLLRSLLLAAGVTLFVVLLALTEHLTGAKITFVLALLAVWSLVLGMLQPLAQRHGRLGATAIGFAAGTGFFILARLGLYLLGRLV